MPRFLMCSTNIRAALNYVPSPKQGAKAIKMNKTESQPEGAFSLSEGIDR